MPESLHKQVIAVHHFFRTSAHSNSHTRAADKSERGSAQVSSAAADYSIARKPVRGSDGRGQVLESNWKVLQDGNDGISGS